MRREAAYDLKTYFTPPPHLTFDPPCSLALPLYHSLLPNPPLPNSLLPTYPDALATGGTHTAGAAETETGARAELDVGGKRSRRTARSVRRKWVVELGSVRLLFIILFRVGASALCLAGLGVPVRSK